VSRILLVGKGAPDRGGIPSFLDGLLRSDLARAHDLRFLNVAHPGTPQGGQVTLGNLRRTVTDAAQVWRAAGDRDVVHIHSALAPSVTVVRASLLAWAARARGAKVIVHAHGGNVETWLRPWHRRMLMRVAMWPAARVVAVWTAGERALSAALGSQKVCLVDNGVESFDGLREVNRSGPPRILYVGLLTPRKGVVDLVDASRELAERGIEHELLLLGGTPDEGPDAEVPVRAAAEGRARLLGTRPPEAMADAYASADIFCLPSWWEAMPLSVLEAMSSGLPVVATDVGDVARAVADGETGFVIAPHAPTAVADALEKLLVDADLRHRMGEAGRRRVRERFSSEVTARAVSDLYDDVARDGRGQRRAFPPIESRSTKA
jgi:glycosyltransferase involved in cell wall biosynthesis